MSSPAPMPPDCDHGISPVPCVAMAEPSRAPPRNTLPRPGATFSGAIVAPIMAVCTPSSGVCPGRPSMVRAASSPNKAPVPTKPAATGRVAPPDRSVAVSGTPTRRAVGATSMVAFVPTLANACPVVVMSPCCGAAGVMPALGYSAARMASAPANASRCFCSVGLAYSTSALVGLMPRYASGSKESWLPLPLK